MFDHQFYRKPMVLTRFNWLSHLTSNLTNLGFGLPKELHTNVIQHYVNLGFQFNLAEDPRLWDLG